MDASEDLYCAEQISIPPTFPYLLRQYAKAAIRTQPVDLLKWSSTYFRCLSLNCPPPVKTRLEYPIPDDWHGLTPGWVKSLYMQIHPNATVEFKVLWDRWVGSCLEHDQLIKILCLGDFRDPLAVPWLQFIGLCASMICNSLTQTMILVCEILTEEPDGSSASITVEHFLNIYKFLAPIDASKGQWLKNRYFPDSLLGLWKEKKEKFEEAKRFEESEEEGEICSEATICETVEEKAPEVVEITKEVSCPSIKEDDYQNIEEYLQAQAQLVDAEEEDTENGEPEDQTAPEKGPPESRVMGEISDSTDMETDEAAMNTEDTEEVLEKDKIRQEAFRTEERQILADMDEKQRAQYEKDLLEGKGVKLSKKSPSEPQEPDFEEKGLLEDLIKLKALQEEMGGEDDHELEEFKEELMKQLEKTPSELEAMTHFAGKLQDQEEKVLMVIHTEDTESKSGTPSESIPEIDDKNYEDVFVEAVPGIGPTVPEELVKEVERYMKEMAKVQHGMVMPRNIKHYDCPPLEELDDLEKEIKLLDIDKKE